MADLLESSPLTLHYAYFILTSAIGSIIFYTASSHIHGLRYSDALFMCFSAMTGTGLSVMDLSTLNPLQQGTLFSLLILGHAFPIFATISLFRVWKFRSALKDHSSKEKKQTVPEIPTLQAEEKQMACDKEGALSVKVIDKAIVREVQSDVLSPSEPAGSYNGYGFIVVTDPRHPNQNRKVTSIIADKKDVGNRKAHNSSLSFWLKGMVQRAANHLSYRDSINCEEPGELWRRSFDFALTQSQNVCAYLYPAWHTWFVLGTIFVLNAIMWGAFEVSAVHNEEIGSLPIKFRVLDGLFQALAVRGGGFSVVAFDRLPQGLLILYVFMMYLSAFPVSATISSTNIAKNCFTDPPRKESYRSSLSTFPHLGFVYQQFRSQFSHDVWWLSLAILLIAITESDHFKTEPLAFSTFRIIFEAVSAYSCVGVSFGYPGQSYSFCVALGGRHRGLSFILAKANPFPEPRGIGEEKIRLEEERRVNIERMLIGYV
ncbi:hypothetical protein N7489_004905 [Penicillium chrysogenum]|uniref:uncharacterized protein n=1 Tax=Penicillium chrysogenum TaxID=5076 RepID=UPI0024DF1F08|nr:uncharacterized protein N7489_004905 [Penicillium chrysogenum]KAJ5244809.1 hypothetical protein N7489_004905 [Penicillium chrysogenum]